MAGIVIIDYVIESISSNCSNVILVKKERRNLDDVPTAFVSLMRFYALDFFLNGH